MPDINNSCRNLTLDGPFFFHYYIHLKGAGCTTPYTRTRHEMKSLLAPKDTVRKVDQVTADKVSQTQLSLLPCQPIIF